MPDRQKLVILGTGFASFSLVKDIDVDRYDVHVVSPRNHFLFTPLLPSTTVGTVEFRSIIEPIRTARKRVSFYQASCAGIDFEKKQVDCRGAFKDTPFNLEYDILVIGVGAISHTFGVPGVEEHAVFLKELADARAIRQKIIECFERACKPGRPLDELRALLHFVVVGGGPTGVEFSAEIHDFIQQDLRKWFPDLEQHACVTLLEAQDAILTSFDERLSAYALKHFGRTGVKVRTKALVREVKDGVVELDTGEEIPCSLVVWSTGIGPTELIRDLNLPKDRHSRLLTDETFKIKDSDGIYAIGDCACIEGQDLPPTAQVAQQEGTYLAKQLNRLAKGREGEPFEYKHMGMLAYIGQRRALADFRNVKGHGFSAWLFWRSAYLTKLVSLKNKILVFEDWVRTFFFGRDISRF